MKFLRWWLLMGVLCFSSAFAEVAVPELKQRVTDLTGTLSAPQIQSLETKLADFEAEKGAQIGVLILPTTQPETIEQYSIHVVEKWKLGRKGVDDGVLLLIAKDDRKLRIEVGRGLEGALTDADSKRIIAEVMTPALQNGDFFSSINVGVDSLMRVIQAEDLPAPEDASLVADAPVLGEDATLVLSLFFGGTVVLMVLALVFVRRHNLRQAFTGQGGRISVGRPRPRSTSKADVDAGDVLEVVGLVVDVVGIAASFAGGGGSFGGGGASGSW